MRQSGILAAAALWMLDHKCPRIADGYVGARVLANRLAGRRTVRVRLPETNTMMIDPLRQYDSAAAVPARFARAGVPVAPFRGGRAALVIAEVPA